MTGETQDFDPTSDHCRTFLQRVYLYIDHEVLSEGERIEIREHLEACQPCYERYGLEGLVTNLVSRLKGCEPCPGRLKTHINNILKL